MPVEVFTGKLDAPKVEEFTGQLDRPGIVPGSPQALLMSHKVPQGYVSGAPSEVSIGPPTNEAQFNASFKTPLDSKPEMDLPYLDSYQGQKDTRGPAMMLATGLATGGAGPALSFGNLAVQSLAQGGAGAATEYVNQRQDNVSDPGAIAKEGAVTAAGNMAGGLALKGLGAVAKKLFYTPLNDSQKAGAEFAKEKGIPFPLSSAAPGSPGAMIQQGSRLGLSGEIKTQLDANKVAQFLNREVSGIQTQGSPIDEAATKGQQFLRKVFEPGETVYTEKFSQLREAIGDNTPIPLTNTSKVLPGLAEGLANRGTTGALVQQIQVLAKRNPTELTAQQLDNLYGELLKKAGKNGAARPEMNVVLDALAKDADAVGKSFNYDFYDELNSAKKVRDSYRELRNIPSLQKLSEDIGTPRGAKGTQLWMAELFGSPNGKALAELRTRNPELYHELADSWLASNIGRFSRSTDQGIGRALDGQKLREWYTQNASQIKLIFGAPQAKALDNFTNYADAMSGSVARANQGSSFTPQNMIARGGATAAGLAYKPFIMAPTEAGSYVLAKGLSDPNSFLFKKFTEGITPKTLDFLRMSSYLAGQEAAHATQ